MGVGQPCGVTQTSRAICSPVIAQDRPPGLTLSYEFLGGHKFMHIQYFAVHKALSTQSLI